ncbi:hypothetical protein KsCSTR_27330 [Candidatus Kuenenia stuttgartiensis]|jgi:hypothetical protein|uniref:Uncharacterized protein n=1 Tax=Kuenenia stuttgartiensis TaxID=174633 RepID=Q1Q0L4_KUEST|nr:MULTISPECIES: hypothetical protein [Kuenenia]MBE7546152.1 hypothetical protein [Planctomycetia bacterium]MBZ0190658.1 hypothetical protein [Candidatus Kuenenia stuttgartiensis]MCF6152571.1 hypothetical protein [Candidatus Kuenenia stuttgartiensis]MCL4727447.1 hypothetical protein [Candidatus Kuenenia stuttgartiensis]MCZ7621967.1 hypothetical protein [Candidatus Kuenenia sp.]
MRLDKGQIEVVDDKVAEILRGKTGMERLQIVWDLWTYFQKSLRAYLKNLHPEWTDEELQKEIIRRMTRGTN